MFQDTATIRPDQPQVFRQAIRIKTTGPAPLPCVMKRIVLVMTRAMVLCVLSRSGVSHQVRYAVDKCGQHKLRYYSHLRNKENRAPRAPTARQARNVPQREGHSEKGAGLSTTKQRHKIGIRQCMLETL